ncbi:MAG: lysoplasmalogenase [Eubacterium sp.]|nr:lysoplasmalogenase [Eubacterium sp.]
MVFPLMVFVLFVLTAVLESSAHIRQNQKMQRVFKPLCMPLLALLYLLCAGREASFLIIAGLLFGMLGDIFLLSDDSKNFLLGAGSFLAGHICYTAAFLTHTEWPLFGGITWCVAAAAALYAAYLCLVARRLMPSLDGAMRPGILAYMGVILLMSFSSLLLMLSKGTPASAVPFAGSLLFILSDTVLAFSVFQKKAHWPVMPTYLSAQFLIMLGALLVF